MQSSGLLLASNFPIVKLFNHPFNHPFNQWECGGLDCLAHNLQVDEANDCEVWIQWESDTPWYETQDLQGWVSGVEIRSDSTTAC